MTGAFPLSVNSIVPAAATLAVSGLGTVASAVEAVANSVTGVGNVEHRLAALESAFHYHTNESAETDHDLYRGQSENRAMATLALDIAKNLTAEFTGLKEENAHLREDNADLHAQVVAQHAVLGVMLAAAAAGVAYHKWDAIKNLVASGRDTFVNMMSCRMPSCLRREGSEGNMNTNDPSPV